MKVRSRFSERFRVSIDFKGEEGKSLTKQSFAKDADINAIVAKAELTGFLTDPRIPASRQAIFGDFASMPDFVETQNRIAAVNAAFEELPAAVRARFLNDPGQLVDFLADSKNNAEAIELGLMPKPGVTRSIIDEVDDQGFLARYAITLTDGVETARVPVKTVAPMAEPENADTPVRVPVRAAAPAAFKVKAP